MNTISEFFGLNCHDKSQNFGLALQTQKCPFSGKICQKMRKSNPDIKIGTCSVRYQGNDVIICPTRLLEHNQIFIDCFHLLSMHEPGNELFLIPEVKIPGGSVDYFLVSARNRKVKDFVGIELQTMDTTGTVWSARQHFLNGQGFAVPAQDLLQKRTFGMNWKMTLKTILIQMHHKSIMFEQFNKHLVLIVQTPLLEHMIKDFDFEEIQGVRTGDPIHIHSYTFQEHEKRLVLTLAQRMSTDTAGIAKCLGLHSDTKLDLQKFTDILESKLREGNRLQISF